MRTPVWLASGEQRTDIIWKCVKLYQGGLTMLGGGRHALSRAVRFLHAIAMLMVRSASNQVKRVLVVMPTTVTVFFEQ